MKAFGKYEFDEIVVTGPHALNAIKNEYPKLEGAETYKVRHYTQLLVDYIDKMEFISCIKCLFNNFAIMVSMMLLVNF